MNLNELIMESIKPNFSGKKNPTSVQFGGEKKASLADANVDSKNQAALEAGLKGKLSKDNTNPQGEGGKDLLARNPDLAAIVAAAIAAVQKAGQGAKAGSSAAPSFTPPGPATK